MELEIIVSYTKWRYLKIHRSGCYMGPISSIPQQICASWLAPGDSGSSNEVNPELGKQGGSGCCWLQGSCLDKGDIPGVASCLSLRCKGLKHPPLNLSLLEKWRQYLQSRPPNVLRLCRVINPLEIVCHVYPIPCCSAAPHRCLESSSSASGNQSLGCIKSSIIFKQCVQLYSTVTSITVKHFSSPNRKLVHGLYILFSKMAISAKRHSFSWKEHDTTCVHCCSCLQPIFPFLEPWDRKKNKQTTLLWCKDLLLT